MTNTIDSENNLDGSLPASESVQKQKASSNEERGNNPRFCVGEIMKKILFWWRELSPYGLMVHRVFSLLLSWIFVSGLYFIASSNPAFNIWSLYLAFFMTSFVYGMALHFMGVDRPKVLFGENLFRYLCLIVLAYYAGLLLFDEATGATLFGFECALTLAVFLLGVMDGFTFFHPRISRKPNYLEGLGALYAAIAFGVFAMLPLLKAFGAFTAKTSINLS